MLSPKKPSTESRKRLRFEELESRLVLSAVLPFSQLEVTSSGSQNGLVDDKAFNGDGLVGNLHTNDHTKNWLAADGIVIGDQWLKIDLGGTYELDFLRVWNNNHPGLTAVGISQADIYVATADPGNNVDASGLAFDPTGWTIAIPDQAFSISPGGVLIAQTDPDISLGNIPAAYLAIKIDANHGNPNTVGLSEMQIFGTEISAGLFTPTNLQATGISGSEIRLAWTDNSSGETGYNVFQSTDGTNFSLVGSLPVNATSFTDSNLNANSRYHYQVVAASVAGDSAPSIEASAKTYTLGQEVDASIKIYVSPTGNDSNLGTLSSPFATLTKARTAVQQIKNTTGLPTNGIAVILREGTYKVSSTFSLGASDSGSDGKPITYTSFPGEQARITGGDALDAQWFSPVTSSDPLWNFFDTQARSNLVVADLNAHGITDFGTLQARNTNTNVNGALQFYFNDKPLTLARWPDKGPDDSAANYADPHAVNGFSNVATAISNTSFTYDGNRPDRWTHNPSEAWLHGHFGGVEWFDDHVGVSSLNTATKTLNLSTAPALGIQAGQSYYAYNLVEEITQPGEWYLDRSSGKLYFWAPEDINTADMYVSTLNSDVINLTNASWINLKNLVIEGGREDLVAIQGGSNNLIEGSTLRHSGRSGVILSGSNQVLRDNDISYIGETAIFVGGGDRPTLVPANNIVTNNEILRFGEWVNAFNPGVEIEGVGQQVSHNNIYHSPQSAIVFRGNDHVIELNDIHDVVRQASDMGAIYSGRDWGWRGNVIKHNFIHDVWTYLPEPGGEFSISGVYLDDALSGTEVFGNVIYSIDGFGILHGGGRDNLFENNILARTDMPLFTDNRGYAHINHNGTYNGSTGFFDSWDLLNRIEFGIPGNGIADNIDRHSSTWATAYPELDAVPNDFPVLDRDGAAAAAANHWLFPEGSVYSKNIGFQHLPNQNGSLPGVIYSDRTNGLAGLLPFGNFADTSNNLDGQDPLFVNEATLDLNLLPSSPAFAIPGFQAIPFDQIGRIQTTSDADFNNDGDVNGFDFLTWQRGFGTDAGSGQAAPQNEGNANGDQFVNADDLTIWQDQYGQNSSSTAALTTTTTTVVTPTRVEPSKPISTPIASSSVSSLASLNALMTARDEALASVGASLEDSEAIEVSLDEALQGQNLTGLRASSLQDSLETVTDSEESDTSATDKLFEQLDPLQEEGVSLIRKQFS